jgi:Leucine-rich repeat (LRR) protein
LPSELFTALTKLKQLFVHKNKITAIPPEIGNLQGLLALVHYDRVIDVYVVSMGLAIEKISFSNNNIKTLPDEIGACTTLEELYMSNNAKLNYFPSAAGHLRRLKELSLSKCPALKQFPQTGKCFKNNNKIFKIFCCCCCSIYTSHVFHCSDYISVYY